MEKDKSIYKLPEGWIEIEIKDISLKINYGYTAKSVLNNTGTKFLRITDIQDNRVNWESVPFCEIDEYNKPKFLLNIGDIVFARTGATVGKSFFINENIPNAVFASYLIRIQLSKHINPKYVYYYFQSGSYWKQIGVKALGVGQPHVNANSLSKLNLLLPPLPEQQCIVSKIETLFSELDQAEKELKKAKKQLKVYRHALLKSAFERTKTVELKALTELITKGASPKWQGINYTQDEKQVLFVTSENVQNNFIDLKKKKFVENKFNEKQKRSILQKGDVLINIVGASIGRAAIFNLDINANINQAVSLIRLTKELEPKFLSHYLISPVANEYYQTRMVDVARANLSLKDISEIPIPIFTKDEQHVLIAELESRFTLIENLEKTLKNSLLDVNLFRHSILKKAFEGKLLNQDSNDESANELLQKIKKEKEEYLKAQKELEKLKPKNKRQMDKKKTVLEILKESKEPISTQELWTNSIHDGDIESFYSEIKVIYSQITEIKEETESLLSLSK